MSNTTLKNQIAAAFAPYAKGFCLEPAKADVTFSVDNVNAVASFKMSAADYAMIDGDPNVKSVITRAYAGLVRQVSDSGRNPILVYGKA